MSAAAVRSRRRETVQAIAAELSKLSSLPAIWLTLGGTLCIHLLLAAALASAEMQQATGMQNTLDVWLASISYTQAGFVILGILAACSEYTGGQNRTTPTAMPRRGLQLVTAQLALTIVVFPAAAIIAAAGVVLAANILGGELAAVSSGRVVAAVAGATGYLALTTLISAAVGVLLRRTLPATVVVLGYYFIVGPLLREWVTQAKYLPDTAGLAMWFPQSDNAGALSLSQGAILLIAWTLVTSAVAMTVYRKRDM